MKRVGIVGFGTEGRAAYDYWRAQGDDVTILDENPDLVVPDGAQARLGKNYLETAAEYDLLVRSPGTPPEKLPQGADITSSTREFFAKCPAPIIGVTGTKGKGTTSTLITEILKSAGKTVWLGGNIGRAALEFLPQVKPNDWVVLELSSFQLVDLEQSPHVGVCLMIVPEHVIWHGGMQEYAMAKAAIARYQTHDDVMVYHARNDYSRQIAELSAGRKVPYLTEPGAHIKGDSIVIGDTRICATTEVGLPGPHNLENICAAVTATWQLVDRDVEAVGRAVKQFAGLPNRIERLGEVNGVLWVNDTYSVNPSATMAAMASFTQPKVMILGGFARGLDYQEMVDAVLSSNVRSVVAIGETGPVITDLLRRAGFGQVIVGASTMPEIVAQAAKEARAGDAVILSPGCASYGMFANYIERGKQFVAAVQAMQAEK